MSQQGQYNQPQPPQQHSQQLVEPLASDADRHLSALLPFENEKPWLVAFAEQIRDFFFPKKEPPLRVTSRPVQPKEIVAGIQVFHGLDNDARPAVLPAAFRPGFQSPVKRSGSCGGCRCRWWRHAETFPVPPHRFDKASP